MAKEEKTHARECMSTSPERNFHGTMQKVPTESVSLFNQRTF